MKGTLFSADFVYDSSGNPRLLEINTDTSFINQVLDDYVDFADFKTLLSDNSISTLHVVYKQMQQNFVDSLESYIEDECTFITTFEAHLENEDSIYPTQPVDGSDVFILRLAYDENAILDSKYAKRDAVTQKLFHDRSESSLVIPAVHSSSYAVFDSLEESFNSTNVPDYISKPATAGGMLKLYKVGLPTSSSNYRVDELRESVDLDSNTLMNYLDNTSTGRAKSVRTFRIIYGSNLDMIELAAYEVESILEIPNSLPDYNADTAANVLSGQHYFEFTTNDLKEGKGVNKSTYIKNLDGTGTLAINTTTGSIYASYFISGSPDTDDPYELTTWSHSGDSFPSGSYATGSILVSTLNLTQRSQTQHRLTVGNGNDFLIGGNSMVPAYTAATDTVTFKVVRDLTTDDSLFMSDGNITPLTTHSVVFYDTRANAETIELNLEDEDIYIVSGSDVIVHNGPCFVAGTQVWDSPTSEKAIEEFKVGDRVTTYNFDSEEFEVKEVLGITSRKVSKVVEYTFSNGKTLTATLDHPLYVKGLGWASYDPELSNSMYNIGETIQQIAEGQTFFSIVGPDYILKSAKVIEEATVVYNLSHVDGNHNFFAGNILAHNRGFIFSCFKANSLVEMYDNSYKKISEVVEGDVVKSSLNGKIVAGEVTKALIHPVMSTVRVAKSGNTVSDLYHPIEFEGNWLAAKDHPNFYLDVEYVDFFYNLEIDGNKTNSEHNYIIDGMVVSGLGDNKELNNKYQRQNSNLINHL